jgi:hypothetical protein
MAVQASLRIIMFSRVFTRRAAVVVLVAAAYLAAPVKYASAQEFNCSVTVNYSTLGGSDFTFLGDLQDLIEDYINQNSWTDDRFLESELIECTIQLVFEEAVSLTSFKARLIVASRRPIYNTTQHTTVVQFNDSNLQFNYASGQSLTFDPERYDPLTSVLNFYAYVMLGYDYDTFSELGGTRHFERARRVAERAQSQSAPGWSQVGTDRGRMNLITQILEARFRPMRRAYFDYHFAGLDRFVTDTETARESVLAVLLSLQQFFDDVNRQYAADLFFSVKSGEITSVFEGSQSRTAAYDILTLLDPAHTSEYEKLVQ